MRLTAIVRLQWLMTWRSPEQLLPIFLVPLSTFVAAAIIDHAGRPDLLVNVFVAVALMSIIQTGLMTASEILTSDRSSLLLLGLITTPTRYPFLLFLRITVTTSASLAGAVTSYLILYIAFETPIRFEQPAAAALAILLTVLGSACFALLLAALIARARSARAIQNSLSGPVFLLSGALVPVTLLSPWLVWPAMALFPYWAAELLRASVQDVAVVIPTRLVMYTALLVSTGAVWGVAGALLLGTMLERNRQHGSL